MDGAFFRQKKKGIEFYMIPSFAKTDLVKHAFTGRKGGFSQGKYSTLNLSVFTEDDENTVLENRRKLLYALGIEAKSIVSAQQIHGDHIYKVTLADKGRGAYTKETAIPATDALITQEKGIALLAFFADCVPVFFLDPGQKVIALAHAGWRGTVAKIAAKTAQAMFKDYGTKSQDLLVGIGPSIGPCHYQVDQPVIKKVEAVFPTEKSLLLTNRENGLAQLNLGEANRQQLLAIGIPAENITVSGLCTYCYSDQFFSHRWGMLGRQAAIIMLK
ncbi:MAG: peptidoglycan editing factor PgeF [Clostridia bacterium]|jgi:YfiH family protein|nr:peptidoglycan editing factor PgeF [Clostridia bacterium]